jgi:hypothetical protein
VVHANLDSLGLSSSGFSRNKDGLIRSAEGQSLVGKSGDFVYMRLQAFASILIVVVPNQFVGVESTLLFRVELGEPLERVASNNDISCPSVRLAFHVTVLEVVKDSGL